MTLVPLKASLWRMLVVPLLLPLLLLLKRLKSLHQLLLKNPLASLLLLLPLLIVVVCNHIHIIYPLAKKLYAIDRVKASPLARVSAFDYSQ